MTKTLSDVAEAMRDIDFCTLVSHTADGSIGGRPMSNNRNVDFDGESRFFTYEDRQMIRDIETDPNVGVSYVGKAGLLGIVGKPGMFIHVEGVASLVRDASRFAEFWDKTLDRWFPQGPGTPGTIMIEVNARRVHYWDGEEEGEVSLDPAANPA
ncbi:pyridoxamine 5'-phosphate oxidase family protein [Novosphingobium lentum]|uniref:pyridoxamine 5'-phosphate oxidase family protein n=1 Tax=Novosphingobium lentum TaxID=145287 RepID=UPI00083545D6|nr:pyridoxamine 5'-phosphate oxidase family protein [Novosphingobium lentum]